MKASTPALQCLKNSFNLSTWSIFLTVSSNHETLIISREIVQMRPRHLSYTHKADPDKFKRLNLNKEEPFGRSHIDSIPKNEEKTSLPEPREQTPHKTLQTSTTASDIINNLIPYQHQQEENQHSNRENYWDAPSRAANGERTCTLEWVKWAD